MSILTRSQIEFWEKNGYLHINDYFTPGQKQELIGWVEELEQWPETPGKWMKYFEPGIDAPNARLLCRVENFLDYHEGFKSLLNSESILGMLSGLMNEPAVLFKEKINFKLPGGNGFTAHQDAPAFTSFEQYYHITMMISIDPSNIDNGCLEMVPGKHREGLLPMAEDKTLAPEVIGRLNWEPLPTQTGDIVFFDSYIPHRSGPNKTDRSRRALYITYNPALDGCYRHEYYQKKRDVFPPEVERISGKDYGDSGVYNIGNPVKK